MLPSRSTHGTSLPLASTIVQGYHVLRRAAHTEPGPAETTVHRALAPFHQGEFGSGPPGHGAAFSHVIGIVQMHGRPCQFGVEYPDSASTVPRSASSPLL